MSVIEPTDNRPVLFGNVPWRIGDIVKALVAAFVLVLVILAIAIIIIAVAGLGQSARDTAAIAANFVVEAALLGSAWWFSVRKYGVGWSRLGFVKFTHGSVIPLVLLVLVLSIIVNMVYGVVISLLGVRSLLPGPLPPVFKEGGVGTILGAVLAVVVAPLVEETFFRGFLFAGIARRRGFLLGAVISALLFALSHLQLGAIIPVFILGLFLAWLYKRTGTLWSNIAAHFTYNSIVLLIAILGLG